MGAIEIAPGFFVHRALPTRERRTIGAWSFLDHYGPLEIAQGGGMRVPPHPHIGLQTVTWLIEGEALHRDSLGSEQLIEPGQLNLMTSGNGIAHAEFSSSNAPPMLHGLQLWIALPDGARHGAATFEHHAALPTTFLGAVTATVFIGEFADLRSPAKTFTPLAGVELHFVDEGRAEIPLNPAYEYGILRIEGSARAGDVDLEPETLHYLGAGRDRLVIDGIDESRLLLLGGAPFDEPIVMWWNFVARTADEIAQARKDWVEGSARFGSVAASGERMTAPPYAVVVRPPINAAENA